MKKLHFIYLFVLLFCSFSSFAQDQRTENEKKTIQNAEEAAQYNPSNTTITTPTVTKSLIVDQDDDGMDDDWETSHELDPNDPKDAWHDADKDNIFNLFEYQLDTDPNDSTSPSVTEFGPAVSSSDLSDLIDSAEGGIQVIRLSQGLYEANVLNFYSNGYKLMIQGGWNDDFTDHNPELYPTHWEGNNDEALYLSGPAALGSDNCTTILDGINFHSNEYFYLNGAVTVFSKASNTAISIYNCSISSNPYYGLGLFHWDELVIGEVYIVNSIIGNNLSGAAYTQVTSQDQVRWRITNTTINNPNSTEGGIDGLASGQANLKIDLTNSINFGNTQNAFNFSNFANFQATTLNSNVDASDPGLDIIDLGNTINEDPLFVDPVNNDWSLSVGSPCIDAGVDIGLKFNDAAPDMGAEETGISYTGELNHYSQFSTFPNPFSDQLNVELEELIGQEVKITLYDMAGNKVLTQKKIVRNKLQLDASLVSSGIYLLQIISTDKQYQSKVLKL